MFSFFRKDKPEELMAFLKEGQATAIPSYALVGTTPEESGMEVLEGTGLLPEVEEAAVLYANGRVGDAAAALNRYLLEHPDEREPLPWLMLFDLYEASNQAEAFEDAAMDFAVKFERSPPAWAPRGQLPVTASSLPLLICEGKFGNALRVKLQDFLREARAAPFVRIDLSRCPAPDEAASQILRDTLTRLDDMAKPVELIGGSGFAVRLGAAHQGIHLEKSGWLLWLAILRGLAREADFEEAALAYASAFEESPPAYAPPLALPSSVPAAVTRGADPSIRLCGVLGPGCEIILHEISRITVGHKRIDIDLAQVTRIDFSAVGLLLETLARLAQGERSIQFSEGNEMVNTLLRIVGANQFAAIRGRTRT